MILLDDSCAFPSVDHRWIFMILERAGVPLPVKNFLRGIYTGSNTNVEYASAIRRQFAMMRGDRQGSPASAYLLTVLFSSSLIGLASTFLPSVICRSVIVPGT